MSIRRIYLLRSANWWILVTACSVRCACLLAAALLLVSQAARAAEGNPPELRVALVIGNDAYEKLPPLTQAVADAQRMSAALKQCGFKVELGENLSHGAMQRALIEFAKQLEDAGDGRVGLFYFAGHGIQAGGHNYLLGIDSFPLSDDSDELDGEALDAAHVLAKMAAVGDRTMLILDACRDNPLPPQARKSGGATRTIGAPRGLAPPKRLPAGSLTIYAADADQKAVDGLFTAALAQHILTPDLEIREMLRRTREEVVELSRGQIEGQEYQRPAVYDTMTSTFTFVPTSWSMTTPAPPVQVGPAEGRNFINAAQQEMVWIRPGAFTMGSPAGEEGRSSDETAHRVTLTRGYWLGKHEVTQSSYKAVMGTNPSAFKRVGLKAPVENVKWVEAREFCVKLTEREKQARRLPTGYEYRLPTEAQWEYACRAGTQTLFGVGDGKSLSSQQANFNGNLEKTCEVGQYAPNRWGLHDMHGNVWEWCEDGYGDYPAGGVIDPKGDSTSSRRTFRGGGWLDTASYCRAARRYRSGLDHQSSSVGIRVALVPSIQESGRDEKTGEE
jgi:formylglycine-generating enzyme required for sulfatase activity